jgi:ribosomal protein S18 acetylase RimI-like enzyme
MIESESQPIAVRDMTAADAPEVARMFSMLGHQATADVIAARLAVFLANEERGLVAVRQPPGCAGPLLGMVTLHITPVLHRSGPVGRLTALVVDETVRGRGVGRALVEAAEAIFVARGCVLAEVTSNMRLSEAHGFYEKLGYTSTSLRFGKPLSVAT